MFQIGYIISLPDQARRHDVTQPVAILTTVIIAQTSESCHSLTLEDQGGLNMPQPKGHKLENLTLHCLEQWPLSFVSRSSFSFTYSFGAWFLDGTQ